MYFVLKNNQFSRFDKNKIRKIVKIENLAKS